VVRALPLWLAAAWLMSLSTIGFLVVPLLFVYLPSPALAGGMAAHLFSAQTVLSVACAIGLLVLIRLPRCDIATDLAPTLSLWALGGVLLALLVELGVAPRIVAREDLAFWHRIGTAMYAGQWVCALAVFAMLSRSAQRFAPPEQPQPGAQV
jgi:Domain of unknown function (DUF4149)